METRCCPITGWQNRKAPPSSLAAAYPYLAIGAMPVPMCSRPSGPACLMMRAALQKKFSGRCATSHRSTMSRKSSLASITAITAWPAPSGLATWRARTAWQRRWRSARRGSPLGSCAICAHLSAASSDRGSVGKEDAIRSIFIRKSGISASNSEMGAVMDSKPANNAIQEAADRLWQAQAEKRPCAPVRDLVSDVDAAYAVQQKNTERWLQQGRRLVGRKIGLTSRAVQKQLGVDQPDFGMLFADMCAAEGELIDAGRILQAKIEAEIALIIEPPLIHDKHTVADIIDATAYALPALEIVGSRIANWNIGLSDTIADNASGGMFVLGSRPVKLSDFDIVRCGMLMERRGDQVSIGAGAACLGNPLHAAVWLADVMTRFGQPLQPGDIIMTGALGPMVAVSPGDVFDVQIEGLGRASASFGVLQ